MIFSARLHSERCDLCLEKTFLRYQCKTCDYLMCLTCYQKYLSFKYKSCPQCRQILFYDDTGTASRMDDIVPTISNCTLKNYLKIYLITLLGGIVYWFFFFDYTILSTQMMSYLFFFLFMGMIISIIPYRPT